VRKQLGVQCPADLVTPDLESEIFLHLVESSALTAHRHAGARIPAQVGGAGWEGDGMAAPVSAVRKWRETVAAPVWSGGRDIVGTIGKIGGALGVGVVKGGAVRAALGQLARQSGSYEALLGAVYKRGISGAAQEAAAAAAKKGLTKAAARYGAIRTLSSVLTPVMWAWVVADLAVKASGTDYGRLVRAIFTFAQIRLTRTYGFTNPGMD